MAYADRELQRPTLLNRREKSACPGYRVTDDGEATIPNPFHGLRRVQSVVGHAEFGATTMLRRSLHVDVRSLATRVRRDPECCIQ